MESTHLQVHGGNASSAMTSSILLHCAANLAAIHSVATAGVAEMFCWCYENVLSPWCDECREQREEEE